MGWAGGAGPYCEAKFCSVVCLAKGVRWGAGALAAAVALIGAAQASAYTVTDFQVDPAHATLGNPHEVASPPFNQFQVTIFGSFNVSKCYQVSIKREGDSPCGSANSSGTDTAEVFADHLLVDISPIQQNADFKSAANWRIEIRERSADCVSGSGDQVFPDSPGEPYLRIRGCNSSCMLSGAALSVEPHDDLDCGDTIRVCAFRYGGGTLGSGNLEYDWDTGGDGTCGVCSGGPNGGGRCSEASDCPKGVCTGGGGFGDRTTHTGDPGCPPDQPCCITMTVSSSHTVGVKIRDLGTQRACTQCKTAFVDVDEDHGCDDGLFCNGSESCDPVLGCVHGAPPSCDDGKACTIDTCVDESSRKKGSTHACIHTPSNALCDDGRFCNGAETCSITLGCQPGTPPNCTDGVACTVDSCDPVRDSCVHTPNNASCNDGLFCNGVEVCDPIQGCKPGTPPNCSDSVACTIDTCDESTHSCKHTPNNGSCDDGLFCNGVETCDPVLGCRPGTPVNCDDGIPCTTDSCNEATKSCVHTPNNSLCNDGQYCNGVETCSVTLGCVAGAPPNCNDGIPCTVDACDEVHDTCTHTPNNAACSDGLFCNGVEVCDAHKGCKPGSPPNCSDGVACTTDSCNEATDSCDHIPNNAACNDGLFCNGVEVCHPTLGCQPGSPPNCDDGVPCTTDTCNEVSKACVHTPSNAACDDGVYCNGVEVCDPAHGCRAGTQPNCDDGVPCTTDTCNEATHGCDHTPNNALCSDGLFCNGAEICDPVHGCKPGTPPNCNDGVSCTVDACDETGDQCIHTPSDALCNDGLFCNGQEFCDPILGCQGGTPPCHPPLICDEPNDRCVTCLTDAQCNDGVFCNGVETCNLATGSCRPGTPPSCDDGIPCTVDTCNTATDSCEHTPNHDACSDGLYCNGGEICDPALGCRAGTPPNCDDGVPCTVDACDEANDACTHTPDNAACSNGLWCDGVETCHPTLGCQAGTPPDCNDGVACTIDSCDEAHDTCVHVPTNALCDDGQWCNGAEVCDPINGCRPGTPPDCNDGVGCTVDSCDEATDTCKHVASNALCSDGQYCNGVEVCDPVHGCQQGTPPNCDDGVPCTTDHCNETTNTCDHTPNNAACSDGLFCNGAEICDPVRGCQPGTPPNCDDAVPCTTDTCNEAADTCEHTPNNAACSDGVYCNGAEICDPINGCLAGVAPNCDDGIPCTVDACDEVHRTCTHTPKDAACSDGLFCNGAEVCNPTLGCQPGTPPNCDDGVPCTSDACDEANDTCTHTPNNSVCANGLFCDGQEYCDPVLGCRNGTPPCNPPQLCDEPNDRCVTCLTDAQCDDHVFCNGMETCNQTTGSCQAGPPPSCDDGVPCTVDSCNLATDSCEHTPNNAACNNGLYCDGVETCHQTLGCRPGTPPNCDDGVACTTDACDESTDTCTHTPNNNVCNDGLFCNGLEYCDPLLGCHNGTPPCVPPLICDEPNDRCVTCLTDAECNDGVFCNGVETCNLANGSCQPGTPPNCGDGLACTVDVCNPATDRCEHTPNNGACSDGIYCNGTEICDSALGCQPGTPPNCDDGVACTTDVCDEANHRCTHTPNNTACDNGSFCDGQEYCDPILGCQNGTPPCNPPLLCDEPNDRCVNCLTDAQCNDGVFCNGVETCNTTTGVCQSGTPPTCNDGVPCTVDSCNPATDACEHLPNNLACSDGQFCNGAEVCDPVAGCLPGTPPNCDDGVACTIDSCDEANDTCKHKPSDTLCSDGQFCNGAEVCDQVNGCEPGTPPVCNDGVPCTIDSCDEAADACVFTPDDGACSDGRYCNGTEVCNPTLGCQAGTPPNCDDGVACTVDACDEAHHTCTHTPADSRCDDGLYCNGAEYCDSVNGCQPGTPPNCSDGVACTIDSCDEANDRCVHTPSNSACDDGQFCNGAETCDPVNGCQAGTPPNCSDGVGCTVDSCDEVHDVCVHTPNDAACDDGQFCNGVEYCDLLGGCQLGAPPNCDDGVACTIDSCDEIDDVCLHEPDHSSCDDGLFCNGQEFCDVVLGCQNPPTGPCAPPLMCDETIDSCVECLTDADCNDNVFCDGVETCRSGVCVHGAPPTCDDGVACTVDSCDPQTDACIHTPNSSLCSDGRFCNGVEVCTLTGCAAGTPPSCDDGVPCTVDVCDAQADTCVHTPNHAACGDGLFCNGAEICDPIQGCRAGTPVNCDDGVGCTVDVCDEVHDVCVHTPNNAACDDGLFCNGAEVCDPLSGCKSGPPVDCNDGIACTHDSCNEDTDSCDHRPDDAACSDGQFCNGVEVCNPLLGCQPGPPVNCDDGIPCTIDSCNESKDVCIHTPNNTACSDGLFCNGQEICTPGVGCQPGAPPNCDDGIGCTADSCDEVHDRCVNTPNNAACDDGLFCNGIEVCDPVNGCQHGPPHDCNDGIGCTIDSCDEVHKTCVHTPNNAVCDDGVFCNGVETCQPGVGCQAGTPVSCADGCDCTIDSCDEVTRTCEHVRDVGLCNDGDACTEDLCTTSGCLHVVVCGACCIETGNCVDSVTLSDCLGFPGHNTFHGPGSSCAGDANDNGTDDACEGVMIPTLSEWGLVVLTLLLLTGAKVYFGVRREPG